MGHILWDPAYLAIGPMAHGCGTKQDDLKNDLQHWPSASAKTKPKI